MTGQNTYVQSKSLRGKFQRVDIVWTAFRSAAVLTGRGPGATSWMDKKAGAFFCEARLVRDQEKKRGME